MIALDTNLLVYAHRRGSQWHDPARRGVEDLAIGRAAWAIPYPCLHEFLAIVTHPKIYAPPSTWKQARDQVDAWTESPSLVLLAEREDYWPELRVTLEKGRISGPRVHDARVVALCRQHGVRELLSADRDFSRFDGLTVTNPLVR